MNCKNSILGENYYGSSILATLQLLTSYGLQGDISVKKSIMVASQIGGASKPAMDWVSLVKGCKQSDDGCLPAVPYCSLLPSDLALKVEKLMNSSITCAMTRRGMGSAGMTARHPTSIAHQRDILQRIYSRDIIPILNKSGSIDSLNSFLGLGEKINLRQNIGRQRKVRHVCTYCSGQCEHLVLFHACCVSQ